MFSSRISVFAFGLLVSYALRNFDLRLARWVVAPQDTNAHATCVEIAQSISNVSAVYFPGSSQYAAGVAHWLDSSSEDSACSVEPADPEDVSTILRIIARTKTPFAIKGGGKHPHVGSSSTKGVHITMTRFSQLRYHAGNQTADIGAGLPWDAVYGFLKPFGVSVVGGRVSGVGVAGFLLGGGLSWRTNMYGLGIDSIVAYEVVLPNGVVTQASEEVNPDIFFALKGGMNNFGIVTQFTMKTYPQSDIWAGVITVPSESMDAANRAVAAHQVEVTDPRAAINAEYIYFMGQLILRILVFYDAAKPPKGVFDKLLAIPNAQIEVHTTDFMELNTQGLPSPGGSRVVFGVAPVKSFTVPLLEEVAAQTEYWGRELSPAFVMNIVEIFLPDYLSHGSPSAYPSDRSVFDEPVSAYIAWDGPENDVKVRGGMMTMTNNLVAAAVRDGQNVTGTSYYPNIAHPDATIHQLYGKNVERLQQIRKRYDPENVMGLAGGYKI